MATEGVEPNDLSGMKPNALARLENTELGSQDFYIKLVEPSGIEPLTSCVQGRRSPS